jgi:hypothetical protein
MKGYNNHLLNQPVKKTKLTQPLALRDLAYGSDIAPPIGKKCKKKYRHCGLLKRSILLSGI